MQKLITLLLLFCSFSHLFAQWESTHGPVGGHVFDFQKNDFYLYAATLNGLYRSADDGHTWSQLNIDSTGTYEARRVGVNDNTIVVFGREQTELLEYGLFKSDDNGDTWSALPLPDSVSPKEVVVTNYAIYLLDTYYLLISTDGGQTWQNSQMNALSTYSHYITAYNQQVYAGGSGKIFRSEPNSDAWTELPIAGMAASVSIISPFDDAIFVREYQHDRLYISTDDGLTWYQSVGVDWDDSHSGFAKLGNAYYGNGGYSIWKTEDLGITWTEVIFTLDLSFNELVGHEDDLLAVTYHDGIQRSSDMGQSFQSSNTGLDAANTYALAFDNDRLLAGCHYVGLYGYDLGTESWDNTILGSTWRPILDIAVIGDKIFTAQFNAGVLRSDDGGISWANIIPWPFGIYSNLYTDGNTLYTSGGIDMSEYKLIQTDDFGLTWEAFNVEINGTKYYPLYFAKNDNYIFTSDHSNVFRSNDGGQNWEIMNNGLNVDQFGLIYDITVANGFVFAIVENPFHTHLFASYTDGEQWQLAETGIPFQQISGGIKHIIGVPGALIAATSSNKDGIYISYDNAQTWQPFNDGLTARRVEALVADDNYIYAALLGRGVWRRSLNDVVKPTDVFAPAWQDGSLSIYPTPTTGEFTVQFSSETNESLELNVLDMQGRTVLQTLAETSQPLQVNLSDVPTGLYFLLGRSKSKTFAGKVMVQK